MKKYDFFISYASEDKEKYAVPLYNSLSQLGFKVWFDNTQIQLGDSLVEKIQEGIINSRYAIILLSENFFNDKKVWTKKELDTFLMRDITVLKSILPVWCNIDINYVNEHSPFLAALLAVKFEDGIRHVITELVKSASRDGVIPMPIRLLGFIWRPCELAFRTQGADVFALVSKKIYIQGVRLHFHNEKSEIENSIEMEHHHDLTSWGNDFMYSIYSAFYRIQGRPHTWNAKCSVSVKTESGELLDNNNNKFYVTNDRIPELINYEAMNLTGQPWMNTDIKKWSHKNEIRLSYDLKKITE
jgi:hypothetical protein